ncbi:MAG: FeoB-associated Cys-rich membrane protein [Pirellulaceae bacterium]|nr:FeoB-associated Cys-rich membrane protein [Pirellulaceae bacterium]
MMNSMDWQHVITILIVALAAAYVLRRAVNRFAGKQTRSCSGCHTCPAAKSFDAVPERPFISAEQLGLFSDADPPRKR